MIGSKSPIVPVTRPANSIQPNPKAPGAPSPNQLEPTEPAIGPEGRTEAFESGFAPLGLHPLILRAVSETGYTEPTPIQTAAIPHLIAGRDLLGCAQTGTGKTAAFALPILSNLASQRSFRLSQGEVRVLVLTPTRELAIQIHDNFRTYGKYLRLKTAVVFGGVGQGPQVRAAGQGLDVLIATPGRLLDLIQQGHLSLKQLQVLVLDEADRMLDMGFIHDVRRIIRLLPDIRHNLFFSATMPKDIQELSSSILKNPVKVEVAPVSSTVEVINQSVMFVDRNRKKDLLLHVLKDPSFQRTIVFTRTKRGANQVSETLEKRGISSAAIHGNKSQNARQRTLELFRSGKIRVLVATDIAARGIDIDGITHVINFELPNVSESYVHRIGRTARAGEKGSAVAFCDEDERSFLRDIEKLIAKKITVNRSQPFHSESVEHSRVVSSGKAKAKIEARRPNSSRGRRPQPSQRPRSR